MACCIAAYCQATGSSALQKTTCGSCAQTDFERVMHPDLFNYSLVAGGYASLPARHLLAPQTALLCQHTELSDGLLLHQSALDKRAKTMKALTLPESLLIARAFPRAYVVKLRPKMGGGDPTSMMDGLMGNVSSVQMPHPHACWEIQSPLTPTGSCTDGCVVNCISFFWHFTSDLSTLLSFRATARCASCFVVAKTTQCSVCGHLYRSHPITATPA